jgi:hypothetical protein
VGAPDFNVNKKIKIAWFSPIEDLHASVGYNFCRSQYFSNLIVPLLIPHCAIDVFTENTYGAVEYHGARLFNFLSFYEIDKQENYDLCLYHVEDHPLCSWIRLFLGTRPSITLFHDVLFETKPPEPLVKSPWRYTIQNFHDQERELPPSDFFNDILGPFGEREASLCFSAIFTNQWCHREYREYLKREETESKKTLFQGRSFYLPIPVAESTAPDGKKHTSKYEIQEKIIALGEGTRVEGRAHKILKAVKLLNEKYPLKAVKVRWMIEQHESERALEIANEIFEDQCVNTIEFLLGRDVATWEETLCGAVAAIHLRHSLYLTASPFLEMSLLHGIPSIVTNFSAFEYLSDTLVFKITPGIQEVSEVRATLEYLLFESNDTNTSLRELRRKYVLEEHDPLRISKELLLIFNHEAERLKDVTKRWKKLEEKVSKDVLEALIERYRQSLFSNPNRELEEKIS